MGNKHKATYPPQRLEVVWDDATYDDDSPSNSIMRCWEIGYLVCRTKRYVELAREWGAHDGSFRFHIKIPRAMIIEERVLRR